MMDLQEDMAVFYGPDFAQPFVRLVGSVAQQSFAAIVSQPSAESLDGYAIGTHITISYPASVLLTDGDHVQATEGPTPVSYTVRDPRATVDGLQATARLELRA